MSKLNSEKFKIVILISLLLGGMLLSFAPAAQALQITNYPGFLSNLRTGMPLNELISTIFNFLLIIAGLAAFIMVVWGGVNYLTSAGDPSKMGDARDQIFKAILGLVVLFSSWMILNTINPQLVELKEPGLAESPEVNPVGAPEEIGYCAADTTYGVQLFARNNPNPFLCFGSGESLVKNSKRIDSVQLEPGYAVRFFLEQNFSGRNVCFTSSYPNLTNCKWGGDLLDPFCLQTWAKDISSIMAIGAGECQSPGITLGQDGAPTTLCAKCSGF